MPPKTVDKLTDAEKKKIKQANKAKANPIKAEEKAKINLKRRIARGQVVDPTQVSEKKSVDVDNENCSSPIVAKPKQTDSEKAEKLKLKMLVIEKRFQEQQRLAHIKRFQETLTSDSGNTENTTTVGTEADCK